MTQFSFIDSGSNKANSRMLPLSRPPPPDCSEKKGEGTIPAPPVVLYFCREVQLLKTGNRFSVWVDGEETPRAESGNPLLMWSVFMDILDVRVRRRIGDMLTRQGLNRYTGAEDPPNKLSVGKEDG